MVFAWEDATDAVNASWVGASTGGLVLDLLDIEGRSTSAGAPAKRGRYAPRKPGKAAAKDAKLARKIVRRRK